VGTGGEGQIHEDAALPDGAEDADVVVESKYDQYKAYIIKLSGGKAWEEIEKDAHTFLGKPEVEKLTEEDLVIYGKALRETRENDASAQMQNGFNTND